MTGLATFAAPTLVLPASLAQERLWFVDRLRPATAAYNIPVAMRFPLAISRSVLERCLLELSRRHEALRTTFAAADGGRAVQVISPPRQPELAIVDLRRHPRHAREERLAALTTAESRRPFDLANGPLFRATLYRLAANDHVLLLVLHHIISDGWSVEVLVRELGALYAAFDAGLPSPLAPLAIQYADWASWQRERLEGGALDEELAFWRRLDGAPTVLDLPSDRPRPEIPTHRGELDPFVVDADLAKGLRALAHRHGGTLYMTCLAAFAALLARHAGQLDLLIGTPMTNRTRPELESVVGLFVNTVVLRVDLRGAPTVSELLQRVRALMLEVHAHAEVPLEKLIETLQPERSAGRHPLFQVLFSLNASATRVVPAAPAPVPTPWRPPTTGTSKFDLSLLMTDAPNGLSGAWEYAADLFDVARIRRMSAHFTRLLRAFVETPDASVDALPLMDEAEERALVAFERAPRRRERAECVHERIFAQARRTPGAVAVEGSGETLTYVELVDRATRFAGRLRANRVGPDERVGVFMRRDANMIVAMLAIHAAGGAYVPLDPDHPRERLAHITEDAGLILVVTDRALAARLPDGVKVQFIDSDENADAPAPRNASPDDLAYVMYTSGTTGRPKGVAVPHRAVAALLDWASMAFTPAEWARVLASTSICFDISVFEIFLPLTEGGSIVVVENVLALAASGAPDVTLINTVPSAMRELLRFWTPGRSLRMVNLAGEALARDLVDRIVEKAPGVVVWNLYGPTETTVYSTGTRVDPNDRATPSIGRPIDGTTVYVLDQSFKRVPVGVAGELYITGAGVAAGYLGRPELTAERYLPDPFTGGRMYRSGDVVCWRPDGTLEYRGRGDYQVKLRGHRIELGEIESTLRKHPRVGEAVVIMRRSAAGDAQLVAYVIMDDPAAVELEALGRRDLPSYMVPSRFVFVDEMPRTATGKIDRAALPAPAAEEAAPARAPATEIEAVLRELFAAALERPSFDVDGDFFTAGGHSLLATGVVARANELLGVELPLSAIFEHSTPACLAAYVDAIPAGRGAAKPRRRDRGDGPLPLGFAQQGMWFYHRLRPKTALYNLPVVLPTRGAVDQETLQRAADHLVARHDALRIRFDTVGGAPVQEVVDEARAIVALHDLTNLPADERRRRAQRLMEREAQRPFDLRRAPLLRVSLLRLSPEESLVVLVMHHIISDGWSTDVLRRDLTAAYEAFSTGTRPALRELPLGYADYVLWQREASRSVLDEGIAYFRGRLAGAPAVIGLPSDYPRPLRPSFRGGIVEFEIDGPAGAALAEVAATRGATAHMAHLAVFAALLHQLARQEDIVIGIPVANRSRPEWRDLVGLFTNTLPIRVACGTDPSFAVLLERARAAAVGAYAHEEVPFDHLVQELSPARDLAHHPIFQVMLGFQEIDGDGAASAKVLASTGTAKFDLSLSLTRAGDRVLAVLEYATDLFERASIERVARRYRLLVEKVAAEPERALDEVAPLDDEERAWREAGSVRTPEPAAAAPAATAAKPSASRTDVERKIVEIWAEALGHDRFGVDESFFEVGGHSLAAVCVIARIAEAWGVDILFEQIFTTPTINALARAVEEAAAPPAVEGPTLRAVERTGPMPLSFAQERLWFLDAMAPGLPVYNISTPMLWRGAVDAGALELALERLGDRHECLRARFVAAPGGGVEQVFDPLLTVDLTVSDLTGLAPAARRAAAERVQAREARHAFDLATGPLLRAHVVELAREESVLFLTIHHIVADARSIDILRRDLAALYHAQVTGGPDALPELPLQFADFALWQRAWLRGDRLAAEIAHWKRKLAGAPDLLTLPSDKPRPREQSYAGMQLPFALGAEVAAGVKRLASEEQATPFMVLLAIYAAVLGRWSGAHDLVIGAPIIGRPKRELEELIGFFSNTLPLRMELEGRPSFRALVRHVREVVIQALSHEDLPFEAIVQQLQPQRSLAHNPLFQVMFAFQQPTAGEEGAARATGTGSGTSKFDLTLFLVEDDELRGAIEYAMDLFDPSTIERLASHLRAAAAAALAAPDAALGELFRASPEDLAVIDGWNATATEFVETSAHALCAAQAARTPDAPAVSSGAESWTYEELMRRARGLAAGLRAAGVGPDSRVAIVADPSPRLIASVLGVWMAGGACVPLDPSYPTARLAYMAETSGARCLVGSEIDDLDMIRVEEGDGEFVAADVSPDHLAYVVFTSGSTGRPKGVAIPHRVLVNLIQWQQRKRPGARRTLQFASPSFDVFFQEVLLTLASGGELVIAGGETRRDPALLVDFCRVRTIERLFLPFVALRELAETAVGQPPLADLREVITAGEQLQVTPALRRWFAAYPRCRLFNQYGPSETHVVTEEELPADPAEWTALPPIGRSIANARCYVLDGELRPLPIGVPGDLHLGGLPLARGYLEEPGLTAERFIPDPHTGGRMYRSGDRARWLPDGRLEFLGRSDDQVKIRGYRVEVAEVETALAALPGVKQAIVAALPDANGEKRLVAYVLSTDAGVDPAGLRERLQGVLPEPLVPAIVLVVDALPRTPSGKVDRRALPAPSVEARPMHKPTSELERIVAGVWRDVLGLDQVGVEESFFALGGHSLLATRVAARLRERLGADVPVRWIFDHPTVARLAAALFASVAAPAPPDEIQALPRDGAPRPSSFAQERLWFLDRVEPGNPAYNLTTGVELPPSLNLDALRRALNELWRRHEALRTVFPEVDGHPLQVVAPAARVPLDVVDLSYLSAAELEAETRQRGDEERRRAFSLEEGPLFRATLLDLGRQKGYLLLLSMHHIVSDAWSLRVLNRDLAALYDAFDGGARPSLPALRVQYADFAVWQRNRVSGAALDDLLAYWRGHLAGAPHRVELPADRPRARTQALRGATLAFELDADVARELAAIASAEGATLFMTVLALYLELLRRQTQQEDFLLGTPIGARPRPELEEVVGLFVNTLVLRADLSGEPTFRALIRRVREETLGAYSHAELPFERLVEELAPRRDLGANPLIQVAFGLHHAVAADAMSGNGTAKFELSLVMAEADGRLSGIFEYDRDLFEEGTIARMAAHFARLARQAVEAPDVPLSRCELLVASEARELDRWAEGPVVPADVDLVDLVARHARRDRSSIAVEAPDGALTYAELDHGASRLAATLDAVPVGVCLGNSKHLPVALVAIWRAGGVYVPLDPALPAARLAYLIRDAGVRILFTDAAGAERFAECGARIILAGTVDDAPPRADVPIDPEEVAYIIYTSGSTGHPKGVLVPHHGLRALVAAQLHALGLGAADRVLKFATQSFDAAVFEMTAALSAGATLCLEAQDDLLPRPELVALLRRRGITMLTIPPSSLAVLPVEDLPALRLLFVAGEACPADLVARWAPGRRMINGYGPTETAVWATYADCVAEGTKPSIGKPVANAMVRVVDRHHRLVPVGVPGELCIAGPLVACGYLGRPEATAAAFVPDPWGAPGTRAYRTGDLVRWRPDGNLDFLGRADGQIKLRGVRIEPSEVEAAIASFAGVATSAVVARGDVLVAYVVPLPNTTVDAVALRRALQDRLPRFLVPSRVVILDELPRTPSGKLDRNALPAPAAEEPTAPAEPMTGVEERVGRIWADVLSVPFGPADNFFELGGHSLLVTRVLSRVRDELGVDVPVRRMFDAPTLAAFCEGLELRETAASSRIPVSRLRREQREPGEIQS